MQVKKQGYNNIPEYFPCSRKDFVRNRKIKTLPAVPLQKNKPESRTKWLFLT